jgi:hypothetical protein
MVMRPPRVSVGGVDIDPCDIPVPLTITYGASDIRNQPDAPSCSFQIEGEPYTVARSLALGQLVEVDAQYTDHLGTVVYLPRFRGRVSDLTVERTGAYVATSVTAVGWQADLANQRVGGDLGQSAYPAQTVEQRYQRIRQDIDQDFRPHVPPPGNGVVWPDVQVPPFEAEAASPLDMMMDVAVTVRGRIVETPAGLIKIRVDPDRANPQLRCEDIVDEREWAVTAGDIINSVTVSGYGPDPYEAVQRTVTRRAFSADYGWRHQGVATLIVDDTQQLAKLADYAREVLDDWAQPRWMMPQITVDCTAVMERNISTWQWLMETEPWQVITVPQTVPAPVPPVAPDSDMIVLGWRETWTATDDGRIQQDMQIALGKDTGQGFRKGVLINLGPVGTPARNLPWQIEVKLIEQGTGRPMPGNIHAEIAGSNEQGPPGAVDPVTGIGVATVPAVDAANVSVNVYGPVDSEAEFSARYPLADVALAHWGDRAATWEDHAWTWDGLGG